MDGIGVMILIPQTTVDSILNKKEPVYRDPKGRGVDEQRKETRTEYPSRGVCHICGNINLSLLRDGAANGKLKLKLKSKASAWQHATQR